MAKKYMIIHKQPPHTSYNTWGGISLSLALAALDQEVSVTYIGDGLYQLLKDQEPSEIGIKNYSRTVGTYKDHNINMVYVLKHDLISKALTHADLLIDTTVLTSKQLNEIIHQQDVVMQF